MFKMVQKTLRALIVVSVSLVVLSSLLLTWFVYGIHFKSRSIPASIAFWMDHDWSSVAGTAAFTALQEQIQNYPIDTLYFHVGPLTESGQLSDDLSLPKTELDALPTTNYAWIGQVRSKINLDDPAVRSAIVDSAEWTIAQGFDGIHLNIEPFRKDDTAYVDLVKELRAAIPDSKISIAMDEWQPQAFSTWLAGLYEVSIESYWSTTQVKSLTPYIDELVVMTYDTGFHDPKLYEWWVEQQTVALSQIVPSTVALRIGLPVYAEGASLDPNAENLSTGLAGFERGVQNVRSQLSQLQGIAIYPYWEMDESEWTILKTDFNDL